MYASRLEQENGQRKLTFVVSGMLWRRSLVMMDLETRSLWSHLLGRAMRGPLEGQKLESLPSVMIDWKTWRREHPDTSVLALSRTSTNYQRDFYKRPSQFVLGVARGGRARAWPLEQLQKQPVVNDRFADSPLLIVFDPASSGAFAYHREVQSRSLTFQLLDGRLVDNETRSTWNPVTGRATAGELAGQQLRPAIGVMSYRRAWRDFHPSSEYWRAESP